MTTSSSEQDGPAPSPGGLQNGPTMQTPPAPPAGASTGQLRFFQVVSAVLLLALLGGGGYLWYRQRHSQPVTILVDGRATVTVADYAVALSVIRRAELDDLGPTYVSQGELRTVQAIAYQHVGNDATIATEADAVARLSSLLHVTANAAVIKIDGRRAAALPDEAAAQAALDAVQRHYVELPPNDPVYGKPAFQEKVEIARERVPASLCKPTAVDAEEFLLKAPEVKSYTVRPGDTGYRIARKSHITLSMFLKDNLDRDVDRLVPGDTVNVARATPKLTVVVQKQVTRTEPIIRGATDGTGGERAISTLETYINGVRQPGSTPLNEIILRRATPRRVIE